MKFFIEQIAIFPEDPEEAMKFLEEMGAEFTKDFVVAQGTVRNIEDRTSVADLAFDYNMAPDKVEFEVLSYRAGPNWMSPHPPSVSHLGMHCTRSELLKWKRWFANKGIRIAQEVRTVSHTNPFLIKEQRKYHYCIFDTREILGVDLKFIVRIESNNETGPGLEK